MSKLAFFVCFLFAPAFSKIIPNNLDTSEKNTSVKLWVLHLNQDIMQFDQLKSPDSDDNRIFRRIIAPAIQKFREHNGVAVTPKEHIGDEKKVLNVSQLKANLLQILNKFSMSMTKETENNSFDFIQPSLKIYFFGPHTSLVVSNGEQHFHYFVNPPSSLPRWFYEEHKNELQIDQTLSVEIPEEVKQELYIRLYNLLHVFFSFPI